MRVGGSVGGSVELGDGGSTPSTRIGAVCWSTVVVVMSGDEDVR